MSVFFLEFIRNMYLGIDDQTVVESAAKVLFSMAENIGIRDAQAFHEKAKVDDPVAKLSTGPVHFSYSGWAFVDISPESTPTPDEDYYLLYDHPYSFEASSWIEERGSVNFCTCFMNAGYSSGWCQESFGIKLTARELLCQARGDAHCRFLMSQPHRLEEFCQRYRVANPEFFPEEG